MRPAAAFRFTLHRWLLAGALLLTALVYWPGLHGGFLFDDYPNIVDNTGVQPHNASLASLVRAALSSPASEFKRPLASLSFAVNYLVSGLDPYGMKLTNLIIHLLNGLLVFLLARALLQTAGAHPVRDRSSVNEKLSRTGCAPTGMNPHAGIVASLIAAGWMLLPINLTGVLYVVQRMESMANLFVLLGMIGYVAGRQRMLHDAFAGAGGMLSDARPSSTLRGLLLCIFSITVPTAVGILAKETAVMLPLYALLIEWALFQFRTRDDALDRRLIGLFLLVLVLPMVAGLAWLLPGILNPESWATRDFTLDSRLLSEARIVSDYIRWTLLPTPDALSFYHDDFRISTGLLSPWTTLFSMVFLAALVWLMLWLRSRQPLVALGIALFLGCQLLTGTILPLELVYEHRNYFASFGLLLATVPLLAVPRSVPLAMPRHVLLVGLMLCWTVLTAMTAYAWGNPLRLAEDLALRAPRSPRAQYELGRTYIIYSHYDPASPFTKLAYAPLEKAAALPDASILAEQALIFMNARMHLPLKDAWWDSMIDKLKARKSTVQDESSLAALTQCAHDHSCQLPRKRMVEAFMAALSHPDPSARLQAIYADYAWNVLGDHKLGLRMMEATVESGPQEPAYRITLIRMQAASGDTVRAQQSFETLKKMNIGGSLDASIKELQSTFGLK